ncbi:hypothetical protein ACTFIY_011993 [Dictyostelium cf. discoideum]
MTTIINDTCIKGVTKEAIKILQFADDTSTTAFDFMDHFKWNTRTLYTTSTTKALNPKSIQSQTWNSTSSTYMGRLIMAKTYALSQLTFHTYINTTPLHNNIEKEIVKFVFNTKSRNSLSVQRRQNNYIDGGLNIWDLKISELAQKAWIFKRDTSTNAQATLLVHILNYGKRNSKIPITPHQ